MATPSPTRGTIKAGAGLYARGPRGCKAKRFSLVACSPEKNNPVHPKTDLVPCKPRLRQRGMRGIRRWPLSRATGPTTLEVAGAEPLTEVFVELRPVAAVAHLAALRASSRLHEARARDGLGGADSEKLQP